MIRKMNSWPRSEPQGQLLNFDDNLSARDIILRYTSKPERGLFIFMITLRIISQANARRSFLHISWIFLCFSVRNFRPAFSLSVTGFCKKFRVWISLTNLKFSVNFCSFLGFPSVEIESDDGCQIGRRISSDNYRSILYHVISFIQ